MATRTGLAGAHVHAGTTYGLDGANGSEVLQPHVEAVALADGAVRPKMARRPSPIDVIAAVADVFTTGATMVALQGTAASKASPILGPTRLLPSVLRTVIPPLRSRSPVAVARAIALHTGGKTHEAPMAEVAGTATGVEGVA